MSDDRDDDSADAIGKPWHGLGPRELASHPDAPPEVLLRLCRRYPREVLGNAALPLLALSEPEVWARVVARARTVVDEAALPALVEALSPRDRRLFRVWCAERALPAIDRVSTGNQPARRLIEIARRWARGELEEEALRSAWEPRRPGSARRPGGMLVERVLDLLACGGKAPALDLARAVAQLLAREAGPVDSPEHDRAYAQERARQREELERLVNERP